MLFRSCITLAAALILIGDVTAASPQAVAQRLRDASDARAAGRPEQALSIVNAVVAENPANSDAARLKVEILLAQSNFDLALDTYDRYVSARRQPDKVLLGVIATDHLHQLSKAKDKDLSVSALERLARSGDAAARQTLRKQLPTSGSVSIDSLGVLSSLTRLGDAEAEASLGAMLLAASTDQRLVVLQAIREANARTQASKVAPMLSDSDPLVRIAVAQTLGVLVVPETAARLEAAFAAESVPTARIFEGVALKRLGRSSADELLAGLLTSTVDEVKLLVGQAYQNSKTTAWMTRMRELASAPNERNRVLAAELLACCDAAAATSMLRNAVSSPNPLLRRDAARVLESKALADPTLARRLLGDSDEVVRLMGAGAALAPTPPAVSAPPRAR